MKHYNIPIFIPHLGCPFKCIFCNQRNIAQEEPAPDAAKVNIMVEDALKTIPEGRSEVEVAFFGGSFTAIDKYLQKDYLQAVRPFLEKGLIDGIRLSTRPDFIDEDILDFLMNNGVKTIEIGVQSLNNDVLKTSGRGYKAEVVVSACHLIKSYGFKLGIQLMVGLPGDNFEYDMQTTMDTISLEPDMVRIYPALVIKDTHLETMYNRGEYRELSLEETVSICCEMFLRFQQKEIDVIRMGLHPAEELRREGIVVAGPFHPAFGELVEQEAFKKQGEVLIRDFVNNKSGIDEIKLFTNNRDISKMLGQKRSNLEYFNHMSELPKVIKVQVAQGLKKDELGISRKELLYSESTLDRNKFIDLYFN